MSGSERTQPSQGRIILAYGLMVAVCVGLVWVIHGYGQGLQAPAPPTGSGFGSPAGQAHPNTLLQLLAALVTVLAASRALGALFRRFHQPPVIGEVLAGILLGPSLLGRVAPEVSAHLFPASVTPLLGIIAQLGVLLFMFVVGLELNTNVLRDKTHSTVAISHASILAPFLLGSVLALWLYPMLSSSDVSFTAFALFMGISMSVTAFPVLARILTDRRLHRTRMGTMALTCAAVDDVTAWCLLAFVVGIIQSRPAGAAVTTALTLLYVVGMFFLVRPLAARWVARFEGKGELGQPVMGVVLVMLLLSALATEYIGIHTLFGAFLFGAVIPHDSAVAKALRTRLEDLVVVLLLPAFFAFTGLRTQVGLIQGSMWGVCGVIIAAACVGKFGGSALAARLTGNSWRESAALGILMNTRGLMELIVLNIGLDLKVISPTLFAMLVLMAVVTTFATTPILDHVTQGTWEAAPVQDGAIPEPG